jgi:hypothetical protein
VSRVDPVAHMHRIDPPARGGIEHGPRQETVDGAHYSPVREGRPTLGAALALKAAGSALHRRPEACGLACSDRITRPTSAQINSAYPSLAPNRLKDASYRMPIPGLYLCGSGAHPGGGVTGAPGHNAAQAMIADLLRT